MLPSFEKIQLMLAARQTLLKRNWYAMGYNVKLNYKKVCSIYKES